MTWFKELTGFHESSPEQVRQHIVVAGELLKSQVNGKVFTCGRLETPTLAELRARVSSSPMPKGQLSVRELVADVQQLHLDEANAGSLFQVASQFNLLEMVSPDVTPESGVGIYENDHTQGPACAIAAGAGTIYRNYFANVSGQIGQSSENQIDCLADIGRALGNVDNRLWQMRNGYALASREGLIEISKRLGAANADEIDQLRQLLRIGLQWNTQVTLQASTHLVSQAFCSALPVAYAGHELTLWEPLARLVLEAAYEATLLAAILNSNSKGNNRLFLTLLGGGVFGNATDWITAAILRALTLYQHVDLDVIIVSYGSSKSAVQYLIDQFLE
jgi:hypothetical protein